MLSVKNDLKPFYEFGSSFSLRQTPYFTGGSYLNHIRSVMANKNYYDFHGSWNWLQGSLNATKIKRDITKALARNFNMGRQIDEDIFDKLWPLVRDARAYHRKKRVEDDITQQLEEAYSFAATLANGETLPGSPRTWSRVAPTRSDENFVIFSDHHMTTFSEMTLENYFRDYNRQLYLDVLNQYADQGFCLVENGDVEECIIYDTTLDDAIDRKRAKRNFPISHTASRWQEFMGLRYTKREQTLQRIINEFSDDYYPLIRNRFVAADKYIRLTGNHDTYLNEDRERILQDMVEDQLDAQVWDVLPISRDGSPAYLVLHGHQFDSVSIQHGEIPYAKSLGEVFSEATSWIYQGPDRFWPLADTKKWIFGGEFMNFLAREEPMTYTRTYPRATAYDAIMGKEHADLIEKTEPSLRNIKAKPRQWIESIMEHEIAWEYFENDNAFQALALEVWTGEEIFKFRHLNERELCRQYKEIYEDLAGQVAGQAIPKLVLGHTHEPRQNAVNPVNGEVADYYLNTGSAGRFENLIWCVEIVGSTDRIVSWSKVNGRLQKTFWRYEHTQQPFPSPTGDLIGHRSVLLHDYHEWYQSP